MDPQADPVDTTAQHAHVNADGTLALAVPDLAGLHPNAANVARALASLGVAGQVRELDDRAATAAAAADFVRAATGQPIGGVAPVGHPRPLRTIVDVDLARYDVVWAAGGHPHYVFPTSYHELLRVTAGEAAEVGEQPA